MVLAYTQKKTIEYDHTSFDFMIVSPLHSRLRVFLRNNIEKLRQINTDSVRIKWDISLIFYQVYKNPYLVDLLAHCPCKPKKNPSNEL